MPRLPLTKIPLPVFKVRPKIYMHDIERDKFLDDFSIKYPIYQRLPEFWRKEFEKRPPLINQRIMNGTRRPQHTGKWIINEKGEPEEVARTVPLRVLRPKEVREGIWGGEGLVKGLKYAKGKKFNNELEKTWRPASCTESRYSEILERNITTTYTYRALDLIDAAFGLDHYILKTPEHELCSEFGSKLKREMMMRLVNKEEMYEDDPEKREKIYNTYKGYLIPMEQIEWIGMNLWEAMRKQWEMEKTTGFHEPTPLLEIYTRELKDQLTAEGKSSSVDPNEKNVAPITIFEAPKQMKS